MQTGDKTRRGFLELSQILSPPLLRDFKPYLKQFIFHLIITCDKLTGKPENKKTDRKSSLLFN